MVVIGTDEFQALARMEAKARGLPALSIAITPHPLGGLKPDAVAAKAAALAELVAAALVRALDPAVVASRNSPHPA